MFGAARKTRKMIKASNFRLKLGLVHLEANPFKFTVAKSSFGKKTKHFSLEYMAYKGPFCAIINFPNTCYNSPHTTHVAEELGLPKAWSLSSFLSIAPFNYERSLY